MSELEPKITAQQIAIADVDGDGELTVRDSQCILVYAAKTMSELETTWQKITGNPNAPDTPNLP